MSLPRVLAALVVLGLSLTACTNAAATPEPTADPPTTASPTPTPPPPPPVLVVGAEDPARPWAPLAAARDGRELRIADDGLAADLAAAGVTDVLALSSHGQPAPLDRDDLPDGVALRRVLVGDAGGFAVRMAASADRIVLDDALTDAEAHAAAGTAVLPLPVDLRVAGPLHDLLTTTDVAVEVADPTRAWELETIRSWPALPGGGHVVTGRRFVALYGHPGHASLGVLGEQGPEAAAERAAAAAAPYAADGVTVVPAFDMIVTIAAAEAGPDNDYSRPTAIADIRPWLDAARAAGVYLVLDLQPGRTDFLTQAQEYEELLREPDVGLALDPEWRLGPNQVHLRQIGSVSADEVNAVADWLAGVVREHRLPQKLFVVHQFKLTMIRDRDRLDTSHPELLHVIQMDGQGSLGSKYGTYDAITRGFVDRIAWGWKNFHDEDAPMATPTQVLELDPLPVFVSFQ